MAYSFNQKLGYIVPVDIGLPATVTNLQAALNWPVTKPIRVNGLLDTGATQTTISPWIRKHFKFPTVGTTNVIGVAGSRFQGFDILIGRDVLEGFDLNVDANSLTFALCVNII
jgi:hypothetical protein